jgi:esterase/lipase superfamily enzyme
VTENYHKWYSQYINAEFEMLVFGTGGIPVIFFPSAYDKYYTAKDNGFINSVADFLDRGIIKLYTPGNYDKESWYNFLITPKERVLAHKNFENLIIHDIIGFANYETQKERVVLAGSGFGGYQVMNFALKHPDKVSDVITLDGFFDIKQFIFGYYDDDCYFNNPPDFLPGLEDSWYLDQIKDIRIILSSSENNPALKENENISGILKSKRIDHKLEFRKEEPGWYWWNQQFPSYLASIID